MKLWKRTVLFYLGGMCYAALELLWRGWTHGSMFVLGGLCFLLIGALGEVPDPLPTIPRAMVAALVVTMMELGCGLIVNRQFQIWDYRAMPMDFCGQICLPFTVLWVGVCLAAIFLYDLLDRHLFVDISR